MSTYLPQEVIRAKRDGLPLSDDATAALVSGIGDGSISEGQTAALAMAICLNGMTAPECVALTRAMTVSGRVLEWPDLGRPILDKHSTGGVGDLDARGVTRTFGENCKLPARQSAWSVGGAQDCNQPSPGAMPPAMCSPESTTSNWPVTVRPAVRNQSTVSATSSADGIRPSGRAASRSVLKRS